MSQIALGFDTETTGKYDFKAPPSADHQPRIMQIGLLMLSPDLKTMMKFTTLIRPPEGGFVIPRDPKSGKSASDIHGIGKEDCEKYGLPIQHVLAIMKGLCESSDVIVCHNSQFDIGMIRRELILLGKEDFLARKRQFCTMKALTNVLKLPGPYGNKWPTLQEAHKYFFGHEFDAAHDAEADITATMKVYGEIVKKLPELLRAA